MNEAIKKMLERYPIKTRADSERALREILQEITLVGLWRGKFFEHAAFYGGTALRILYGLDRFSEDLDFTLLNTKSLFEWRSFEKHVIEELSSYGFTVTFSEKKKQTDTTVRSAFLKTNTEQALLQIGVKDSVAGIHREALIRIKVEIDSQPVLGFDVEPIYLKEPLPVAIRAVKESSLFAGKTHAALYRSWKHRVKGRDWYDLVWFLRRGVPLNAKYLEACMRVQGGLTHTASLTEEELKKLLIKRIQEISMSSAIEDVRPFLRDATQLEFWSQDFFIHWIDQLRFDKS